MDSISRRALLARFAKLSVVAGAGIGPLSAVAESEFEQWQRQQLASDGSPDNVMRSYGEYRDALDEQFEAYRRAYLEAFTEQQKALGRVWDAPEMPDEMRWVEYTDDLETRRVVDFERGEVRISFTGAAAEDVTPERVAEQVAAVIDQPVADAYKGDPVLQAADKTQPPAATPAPVDVSREQTPVITVDTPAVLARARETRPIAVDTPKGQVVTVTVPVLSSLPERAQTYEQQVREQAKRWDLPLNLVFAVMETESTFNPMARSHIPAFGLMQIVPGSAGRDATKHAWGRDTLLSGRELLVPDTNIELGCAYLNLLNTRYLRAVENDESRLYCIIAAYNTGAGNVARSFTGKTSVKGAASRMNRLTPAQMKRHLEARLHYEEARHYVAKVTRAMEKYPTT